MSNADRSGEVQLSSISGPQTNDEFVSSKDVSGSPPEHDDDVSLTDEPTDLVPATQEAPPISEHERAQLRETLHKHYRDIDELTTFEPIEKTWHAWRRVLVFMLWMSGWAAAFIFSPLSSLDRTARIQRTGSVVTSFLSLVMAASTIAYISTTSWNTIVASLKRKQLVYGQSAFLFLNFVVIAINIGFDPALDSHQPPIRPDAPSFGHCTIITTESRQSLFAPYCGAGYDVGSFHATLPATCPSNTVSLMSTDTATLTVTQFQQTIATILPLFLQLFDDSALNKTACANAMTRLYCQFAMPICTDSCQIQVPQKNLCEDVQNECYFANDANFVAIGYVNTLAGAFPTINGEAILILQNMFAALIDCPVVNGTEPTQYSCKADLRRPSYVFSPNDTVSLDGDPLPQRCTAATHAGLVASHQEDLQVYQDDRDKWDRATLAEAAVVVTMLCMIVFFYPVSFFTFHFKHPTFHHYPVQRLLRDTLHATYLMSLVAGLCIGGLLFYVAFSLAQSTPLVVVFLVMSLGVMYQTLASLWIPSLVRLKMKARAKRRLMRTVRKPPIFKTCLYHYKRTFGFQGKYFHYRLLLIEAIEVSIQVTSIMLSARDTDSWEVLTLASLLVVNVIVVCVFMWYPHTEQIKSLNVATDMVLDLTYVFLNIFIRREQDVSAAFVVVILVPAVLYLINLRHFTDATVRTAVQKLTEQQASTQPILRYATHITSVVAQSSSSLSNIKTMSSMDSSLTFDSVPPALEPDDTEPAKSQRLRGVRMVAGAVAVITIVAYIVYLDRLISQHNACAEEGGGLWHATFPQVYFEHGVFGTTGCKQTEIEDLNAAGAGIMAISPFLLGYKNLKTLDLSSNAISELPVFLPQMPLQQLRLDSNPIASIPASFDSFFAATSVSVSGTPAATRLEFANDSALVSLPVNILSSVQTSLTELHVVNTSISVMPTLLGYRQMSVVDFSHNRIRDIDLSLLPLQLRMVDFSHNNATNIKEEYVSFRQTFTLLDLSNNLFVTLPRSFSLYAFPLRLKGNDLLTTIHWEYGGARHFNQGFCDLPLESVSILRQLLNNIDDFNCLNATLKRLDLLHNPIPAITQSFCTAQSNLGFLELRGTSINFVDASFDQLTSLYFLGACLIANTVNITFQLPESLQWVNFCRYSPVTDPEYASQAVYLNFTRVANLTHLSMDEFSLPHLPPSSQSHMIDFAKFIPTMKHLEVFAVFEPFLLPPAVLSILSNMTSLESLYMRQNIVATPAVMPVPIARLQSYGCNTCNMTIAPAALATSAVHLLTLPNNRFTSMPPVVFQMSNLTILNLYGNPIPSLNASLLQQIPSLKTLYIQPGILTNREALPVNLTVSEVTELPNCFGVEQLALSCLLTDTSRLSERESV